MSDVSGEEFKNIDELPLGRLLQISYGRRSKLGKRRKKKLYTESLRNKVPKKK